MNRVALFLGVLLSLLAGRLFLLQIVHHKEYVSLASKQHRFVQEIFPERGEIYARDKNNSLIPLATNQTVRALIISPKDVKNPENTVRILSSEFGLDADTIQEKIARQDDSYEILLKKLDVRSTERIEALNLPGVYFEEKKQRVYPHGSLAAHMLGFIGEGTDKETGQYGLERKYETHLSGEVGFFEGMRDAAGFLVALGKKITHPPKDGRDLLLTIDYNIQLKTEEILTALEKQWKPASAFALVIDPKTGALLAMARTPVFDPNAFGGEKDLSVFLNPLVQSMYELGSVLKPITMAMGIEERVVTASSTYYDSGELRIGGYRIKNFDEKAYHIQTMTQVLEKSLNTGIVHVSRLVKKEKYAAYLKNFGFGTQTGIDLPGEIAGDISNLKHKRDIDFATASFGQGIAVTPLQLVSAIGAIANRGALMKPFVVKEIRDDSGNKTEKKPEVVRTVISESTAETITKMLISAIRNGYENKASIRGYFVAGKTGTAQIPREDGRGYSDDVIHSFIGYAPAFNPRFLIYLHLNKPMGNRFAANTLTPAFHDLAEYILNYYEVPPDEAEN